MKSLGTSSEVTDGDRTGQGAGGRSRGGRVEGSQEAEYVDKGADSEVFRTATRESGEVSRMTLSQQRHRLRHRPRSEDGIAQQKRSDTTNLEVRPRPGAARTLLPRGGTGPRTHFWGSSWALHADQRLQRTGGDLIE